MVRESYGLLWILYGNMVDFSFIVSLYVSDLHHVTISVRYRTHAANDDQQRLAALPSGLLMAAAITTAQQSPTVPYGTCSSSAIYSILLLVRVLA